ncbi:hypothetical protein SPSYN_01861 [Sporotomaculum syntrophicum]|uniref:Oxaloacetate decarboxylase n=1 Tax=Sporotomaculum syntrophicum TaxID=182264 RepID=A0A9D2WRC7_9FIRM|nr:OadG-related small transporter subunit [Sporotomaculum syntrophicum]KAF1085715.1 hypothetical protein SPSYN_01861 [Sporotomaculum syntrophicum]
MEAIGNMTFGWLLTVVGLVMTMTSLGVLIIVVNILKKFQN